MDRVQDLGILYANSGVQGVFGNAFGRRLIKVHRWGLVRQLIGNGLGSYLARDWGLN